MGNYPMRIRWQVHRYLLKQSMTFYQDEFAGRIATKLMQTALAVRECVIKLIDVLNYVIVYFLGMLFIVGSADWRLAMPLVVWLVLLRRCCCAISFRVSARCPRSRPTPARLMTGRVVDSYTNIQTVKLFSHARREASYAREGMSEFLETVYRSMRLVTSLYGLLYILNSLLLFSVSALSIWLWLGDAVIDRRGRGGHRPGAPALGHVAMDHVGGVGAVREHRHRAGRHQLDLAAAAGRGQAGRQGHRRGEGRDRLRPHRLPLRQGQGRHRESVAGRAGRARRSASSAAPAPASRRWSICCCASTTSKAGAS